MNEVNVSQKLSEFKAAIAHKRTPRDLKKTAGDRVSAALQSGGQVIALKPFKAGGKQYNIGDVFEVGGSDANAVLRLASSGLVGAGVDFGALQLQVLREKFYKDEVLPVEAVLGEARGIAQRQAMECARLKAELHAAEVKLQDAMAQLSGHEAALLRVLDGAPV